MKAPIRYVAVVLATCALGVAVAPSAGAGAGSSTFTTSTRHISTPQRVDLPDAEATECDAPATDPVLVNETATTLEPAVETIITFGPDTIYIGEDEQTPYEVADGETNFNTRTTYETVITQEFQAIAAGPPCAVVAAARFTG